MKKPFGDFFTKVYKDKKLSTVILFFLMSLLLLWGLAPKFPPSTYLMQIFFSAIITFVTTIVLEVGPKIFENSKEEAKPENS